MTADSLRPGDCLLYAPKGFFGWIISLKTWHPVAHCEAYVGDGQSVASRDGQGVSQYPLRLDGLAYVLTPRQPVDVAAAQAWFATVQGQKYDWLGLLRFAWRSTVVPASKDNKQFCSEFLTRWYRAGGVDPFNGQDADAIAPFQFLTSNLFDIYQVNE